MKIVCIHGQNHKGNTWHTAYELLKNINCEKEVTEFFLPRDLPHFCSGCCLCLQKRENCPYWSQKEPIMAAILQCDLLVITTPTYCMMPSAPLKSFFDLFFTNWLSHKPYGEMYGKRAVVISTAAGAGAKKATRPVANTLSYWGIPKVYQYGLAVNAKDWETMPEKKKTRLCGDMATLGHKLSTDKKPSIGLKTRFMFWLFAGMQKSSWGAAPEEREYWQQQGWLDGQKPW